MTITEFTILTFRSSDTTFHSPTLTSLFTLLSERQSSHSGYPLHFYTNASDPCELFLTSGWRDVPAHHDWIASQGNQELLLLPESYCIPPCEGSRPSGHFVREHAQRGVSHVVERNGRWTQ
ncbi:hypothetical protein OF83DRAFT_1063849 [Amylostereum chailletii]|nr:hypothetical protein OF83DRAFT_1063849 [Amylostereum chailletii]